MDHLYSINQDRNNVYHGNLLEAIPEAILYSNKRPIPQRNRSAYTYPKTDFSQYFVNIFIEQLNFFSVISPCFVTLYCFVEEK